MRIKRLEIQERPKATSLRSEAMMTTKTRNALGLSVFVLGSAMSVSAFAQSSAPAQADPAAAASTTSMSPDDKGSYATGKPLEMQSKEGFWGHMNPLARKKWVNRQVSPVKDRVNELDQLQSKNANDIKDVDSRAQAGIKNAMDAAGVADQKAQDAATRAAAANHGHISRQRNWIA